MDKEKFDIDIVRRILSPLQRQYICVLGSGKIIDYDKALNKSIPKLKIGDCIQDYFDYDFDSIRNQLAKDQFSSMNILNLKNSKLRYKFIASELFEDTYVYYLTPVVTYNNSIANYNLTVSDFSKLDYISEYIFLQQISGKGLDESKALIDSLKAKNQELIATKGFLLEINTALEQRVNAKSKEFRIAQESLKGTSLELIRALEKQEILQLELSNQEKLSALGNLVASIAHELNTPLGAIKAANSSIFDCFDRNFSFFKKLVDTEILGKSLQLLNSADVNIERIDTRERRILIKKLVQQLNQVSNGDLDSKFYADILVELGIKELNRDVECIVEDVHSKQIFELAFKIVLLHKSSALVDSAVNRSSRIVSALNNYSRTSSNQLNNEFNLNSSIESSLILLFDKLKKVRSIQNNIPRDVNVFGNSEQFTHVVLNIVNNAIQAAGFDVEIKLNYNSDRDFDLIEIVNDGPMIPLEVQDRIFDEFFTTKKMGEGTGLGLNICKKYIENMEGTLTFTSDKKRTSFIIKLPKK